jgi:cytochrome c-type biogenesis protein CcmH
MAIVCLCIAQLAFATESRRLENIEQSYISLTKKLRCTTCQNQNVFDSNAPSSLQLKQEIYTLLNAGKTETQVRDALINRYGSYVLYTPPFDYKTLLLWLGPILMLLGGFWIFRSYLASLNT